MSEDTKKKSPSSIAVIMDGNRRWAVAHGREPYEGHIAGFDKVKEFLDRSLDRIVFLIPQIIGGLSLNKFM